MSGRLQRALAVLLVVLAGAVAYRPALDAGFLNLDDQEFIVDNPWVHAGLTPASARWALTADASHDSPYVDYWQPATLFSRLLDGTLFGLDPAGHHLTSVLLHLANAVLLLLLLAAATGRLWRSAVVALVFATHPLHVSSVVWVTERKDVLGVFFSLLTLAVFARFAAAYRRHLDRRQGRATGGPVAGWYLLLLAGYALCLMSKPMTLSLPLLLLLAAVWPIPRERRPGLGRLALSLVPLSLLAAGAVVLYMRVAVVSAEVERLGVTTAAAFLARLVVSLATYPVRLLFPLGLQHIYSLHPGDLTPLKVAGSILLLGGLTALVAWQARRRPHLAVGWAWYLAALLPASTALGSSAAADRFAYFPAIGLTTPIVWGVGDLARGRWRAARAAVTAAAVIVLALTTRAECRHWEGSVALFSHLLELDPDHDLAHSSLGSALLAAGDPAGALASYRAALAVAGHVPTHHYNAGVALQRLGRLDEAYEAYAAAARLDPGDALGHHGLGQVLLAKGRTDEAEARLREALRLDPAFAAAHNDLGTVLRDAARIDEAEAEFREALRLNPRLAPAHSNLGMVLWGKGNAGEAEAHFREALRLDPGCAAARYNLGLLLGGSGRYDEALTHLRRAAALDPKDAEARRRMEAILEMQRRRPELPAGR